MARIAFGVREIGPVLAERQTFFLRLACSSVKRLAVGDHLWLAEPFYLEARFNDRSPTTARDLGGKPAFAADHDLVPPGYGKRHPARALCRDWHRFHLRILSVSPLRLQDVADRDVAAMGFASRDTFAAHWDAESQLSGGRASRWRDNPAILRFGFELILAPLPDDAAPPKPTGERRGANRQPPPRADLVAPAQTFARRYEQPRHLSATAKNPIDLAPRPVRRVVAEPEPTPTTETPVPACESPLLPEARAPLPSQPRRPYQHVHDQPAIEGEVFTTGKGDKAFLAALKRERSVGHHPEPAAPAQLQRRRTMAPPIAATGTCPRCGTRIAYGCEHYPAEAADQDAAA